MCGIEKGRYHGIVGPRIRLLWRWITVGVASVAAAAAGAFYWLKGEDEKQGTGTSHTPGRDFADHKQDPTYRNLPATGRSEVRKPQKEQAEPSNKKAASGKPQRQPPNNNIPSLAAVNSVKRDSKHNSS